MTAAFLVFLWVMLTNFAGARDALVKFTAPVSNVLSGALLEICLILVVLLPLLLLFAFFGLFSDGSETESEDVRRCLRCGWTSRGRLICPSCGAKL